MPFLIFSQQDFPSATKEHGAAYIPFHSSYGAMSALSGGDESCSRHEYLLEKLLAANPIKNSEPPSVILVIHTAKKNVIAFDAFEPSDQIYDYFVLYILLKTRNISVVYGQRYY